MGPYSTAGATGNKALGNTGRLDRIQDGDDELTGLGGQDAFLFNVALDAAAHVDVIAGSGVADVGEIKPT